MLNITKQRLAIAEIVNVYASSLHGPRRGLRTASRHGDGFILILGGSCRYTTDAGASFTAREGDILYLAAGAGYLMDVDEGEYSYVCVNFTFSSAETRLCVFASPEEGAGAEALFRRLLRVHASRREDRYFESMALLYQIYGTVCTAVNREYVNRGARETVAEIKRHMEHSFSDPTLGIASLAAGAGMSEVYFRTVFRSQYGASPMQHLMALRIGHSVELMRDPLLSLSECAERSGFSSLTYFCRIFKRKMGISPAKYRKEQA